MRVEVKADQPHERDALEAALRASGFDVDRAVDGVGGLRPVLLVAKSSIQTAPDGAGTDVGGSAPDSPIRLTLPATWSPARSARVAAAVGTALRGALDEALPEDAIVIGDLVVDERGHAAARNGVPLDLTNKEFQLLTLLAKHPNRVLDRDGVMDELWGDEVVTPNTIEVHISSLRRKMEAFGPRVVFTVRRVGYVLRPTAGANAPAALADERSDDGTSDSASPGLASTSSSSRAQPAVERSVVLGHTDGPVEARDSNLSSATTG